MSENKSLAIIATKGSLDWAYPPFILASTAAALGYDVQIFFTFYGLNLVRRKLDLRISPLGNPAMPMPFPVPTVVQALPGMEYIMTAMMERKIKDKGVASIEELRDLCIEAEVKLVACQMTVDLFDYSHDDFLPCVEYGGAASFLDFAGNSDICLYI
ncbi:MAG: DsrE/DsrF/DrsH-like family protein [Thiotrichaceae bacterium]|nr:DsrE/DsrF/DrsH-like family protein [Thiotrichaceae bacterium]